jgi:hypothetical protein
LLDLFDLDALSALDDKDLALSALALGALDDLDALFDFNALGSFDDLALSALELSILDCSCFTLRRLEASTWAVIAKKTMQA